MLFRTLDYKCGSNMRAILNKACFYIEQTGWINFTILKQIHLTFIVYCVTIQFLCQGSSAGLERWSHKPEVGGSSPPLDTNNLRILLLIL